MSGIGDALVLTFFRSADQTQDPGHGRLYTAMEAKVLPIDPPGPVLLLEDRTPGEAPFGDAWLCTALTPSAPDRSNAGAALLVNFLNVRPGDEDAVNAWFVDEHLPDLLALPGFLSGRRFRVEGDQPYKFLNLWEVEPQAAVASLQSQRAEREEAVRAGRQPKVRVHPSLIADQRMGALYRPADRP